MFGFTLDEVCPDLEIWPDNWETVRCFIGVSTQWRSDLNGVTGLDYSAVLVVMEMNGVVDRRGVFGGLQIMEVEALGLMCAIKLN